MEIEIFADNLTKADCDLKNHHIACRGIIKKANQYLLVHVLKMDFFTFPGGRLEKNETLEACIKREVLEETGVLVKVLEEKIAITEYFEDSVWTNHYFICEYLNSNAEVNLTEEELTLGMESTWKTLEEIMDLFENYETAHPYGENIHNREFLGFINSL